MERGADEADKQQRSKVDGDPLVNLAPKGLVDVVDLEDRVEHQQHGPGEGHAQNEHEPVPTETGRVHSPASPSDGRPMPRARAYPSLVSSDGE
jgi:hypothetical protein